MYLVQRGTFKYREGKIGIDKVINWDYMGSAEFECGALPRAWRYILDHIDDYNLFKFDRRTVKGDIVYIFCDGSNLDSITKALHDYLDDHENGDHIYKYRLKESISFDALFFDKKDEFFGPRGDDLWFDIEGCFMFFINGFTKDPKFEGKSKKTILETAIKESVTEYFKHKEEENEAATNKQNG